LHTAQLTIIWDGVSWIADIPTEKGDFITASGTWNTDGSFTAETLYINIVNLQGKVTNFIHDNESASFVIVRPRDEINRVIISPSTEIYAREEKSTYREDPAVAQNGAYVEVIGRRLKDGSILAANINIP